MRMQSLLKSLILSTLVVPWTNGHLAAQAAPQPAPHYVYATVVLVQSLPHPNAEAVILRRRDQLPHDVIELPSASADAGRLSAAVASLLFARQRSGDVPRRDGVVLVQSAKGPPEWDQTETVRAARVIDSLRAMPPSFVDGVGIVPAWRLPVRVVRVQSRRHTGSSQRPTAPGDTTTGGPTS